MVVSYDAMAVVVAPVSPGLVVRLRELHSASPFALPNQSLRVVGSLERFDAASGIAVLTDGGSCLRVDLEHLRELPLRVGSLFEFIGELQVHPLQEVKPNHLFQTRHAQCSWLSVLNLVILNSVWFCCSSR